MRIAPYRLLLGISLVLTAISPSWGQAPRPMFETRRELVQPIPEGRTMPPVVTGVAVHRDGKMMVAAGDDHLVRVWDMDSGELLAQLAEDVDWVRAVAFSPDGKQLATAGNGRRIILWDVENNWASRELARQDHAISTLAFSRDGRLIAAAGFAPWVRVFDVATGSLVFELECPCADLRSVAFSPDDALLAAAGRDGQVRVWTVADRQLKFAAPAHRQRVRGVVFTEDAAHVVSVSEDRTIVVTRTRDGQKVRTMTDSAAKLFSVALGPRGQLAVGTSDNHIRLWDVTTGEHLTTLAGHTGSVAALTWHDELVISGSYDTTARIWSPATEP